MVKHFTRNWLRVIVITLMKAGEVFTSCYENVSHSGSPAGRMEATISCRSLASLVAIFLDRSDRDASDSHSDA